MLLQLNNVSVGTRLASFSSQVTTGLQIHLIGPNGAGKALCWPRWRGYCLLAAKLC